MEKNRRISEALRRGEYIPPPVDMQQSWYPPRPIIKKFDNALTPSVRKKQPNLSLVRTDVTDEKTSGDI